MESEFKLKQLGSILVSYLLYHMPLKKSRPRERIPVSRVFFKDTAASFLKVPKAGDTLV